MLEFFRRFSLRYCDLPTMIDNAAFLLRILTINIQRSYTKGIPTICYMFTILAGGSYFYAYVISVIWFILVKCRETGDLVAASVVYSLGACSGAGITKTFYIRFYREAIIDIVEKYLAFDAQMESDSRYFTNLLKALRYVKRRAVTFWLYQTVNGSIYIIMPLVLPGRHLHEDLFILLGLEPMTKTPNYEIAFILTAASVSFALSTDTNTSFFITTLAGYAEGHMIALSEEFNNLWEDANVYLHLSRELRVINETNENNKILNEFIRNKLKDIAYKHLNIIDILGKTENMFRGALALEFGISTSAVISELLGGLESTYVQLPYSLLQMAMNCFIGQRLIDASLVLENAVYCCKWENFDASNQKTVLLMLMNSQKTLKLSVGGLTILSFASFMSILKSIYSAYTALHSRM